MSTFTCPEGHVSIAADYCDVCGTPLQGVGGPDAAGGYASPGSGAAGGYSPAGQGGYPDPGLGGASDPGGPGGYLGQAGSSYVTCPNCSAESVEGSLFCENCGYDFTTGAMPRPEPLSFDQLVGQGTQAPQGYDPLGVPGAAAPAGAEEHQGYDPLSGPGGSGRQAAAPAGQGYDPAGHGYDPATVSIGATGPVAPAGPDPLAPPTAPASTSGVPEWVVEVWVDPGWYALQQSPDPCPSPGMPQVLPLAERSLLIGRHSTSRGIAPQIDCSADVGVSRRHAQLSTDGQRWWIEDLQSANGTYVGPASGPLPTDPVSPNQRHELDEGDRVYVGAWTRLVVRRAAPGEIPAAPSVP